MASVSRIKQQLTRLGVWPSTWQVRDSGDQTGVVRIHDGQESGDVDAEALALLLSDLDPDSDDLLDEIRKAVESAKVDPVESD